MLTIDVSREFPLLRGRKMYYEAVLGELAAFFRGPREVADFKKFGCNYWDSWGDEQGRLNLDYGNAWLDYNGVNQLDQLIEKLRLNPTDRRLVVSGWRPDRLPALSLPCCHLLYQWYVRDGKFLDMVWYQRSVDTMVGLPSDIILAAAWNIILATECGLRPGVIKLMLGDTHIYANHVEPLLEYMRQLKACDDANYQPIAYTINPTVTYKEFVPSDFNIKGYWPKPAVKFALNV